MQTRAHIIPFAGLTTVFRTVLYYAFRRAKTQRTVTVFRTVIFYAFSRAKTQRTVTVFRTVFYYAFRRAKTQRSVIIFRTVFYYAFCRAKMQRTVTVFRTVLYYAFRRAKTQRIVTVFCTVFYYAFRRTETQRTVTVFRTVLLTVSDKSSRSKGKLFKCLTLIFILFILCWPPLYILNCIIVWSPATHGNSAFLLFSIVLSHVNSFIIPIIYATHQPGF